MEILNKLLIINFKHEAKSNGKLINLLNFPMLIKMF